MVRSAINGLAEVVINVRDIVAMRHFYEETLGFRFHSQFPDAEPTIVFLTIADLESPLGRGGHPQFFALVDPERHVYTRDAYVGLDHERSSLNHVAFEIDEPAFASEKQRLEDVGVTVQTAQFPHMQAKGLLFNDPEGNLIELICHVSDCEVEPNGE
jgi:catechol 2,3-dioxygenase-like lactoylglutathione lyase family enzyme